MDVYIYRYSSISFLFHLGYIANVTDVPNSGPETVGYSPVSDITLSWSTWTEAANQVQHSLKRYTIYQDYPKQTNKQTTLHCFLGLLFSRCCCWLIVCLRLLHIQAGVSRLYGGIHTKADNMDGLSVGTKVGIKVFNKVPNNHHQSTIPPIVRYLMLMFSIYSSHSYTYSYS